MAAVMTANNVIASAARLTMVRHRWRNKYNTALIRVPAWPIPIQKTKPAMSQAQATDWLLPQTPIPVLTRRVIDAVSIRNTPSMRPKSSSQDRDAGRSTIWLTLSVTWLRLGTAGKFPWRDWVGSDSGARRAVSRRTVMTIDPGLDCGFWSGNTHAVLCLAPQVAGNREARIPPAQRGS